MDEVNERTTMLLTVAFFDDDGVAVAPTTASYRIDNRNSGTEIVDDTAIATPGTTEEIEITSAQNRILNAANKEEIRVVTVDFTYGSSRRGTVEYFYKVKNLFGITA
jgi:hypothetical protein